MYFTNVTFVATPLKLLYIKNSHNAQLSVRFTALLVEHYIGTVEVVGLNPTQA